MSEEFIQLIICVETNENAKTDYYYIKSILNKYFSVGANKISFIYMDGKYNYRNGKVLSKIKERINSFKASNSGKSYVIYVFDKDNNYINAQDSNFESVIINYCNDKNYHLVWFVKTIEDVLWGKLVKKQDKLIKAQQFQLKKQIDNVEISKLSAKNNVNARHKSNILTVLNKFTEIKKE